MQHNRARVRQRLNACVTRRANKLGLGISPSCLTLIQKMIANGITRMESQGVLEKEEHVWYAEQNLSAYLGRLSDHAQFMGYVPKFRRSNV